MYLKGHEIKKIWVIAGMVVFAVFIILVIRITSSTEQGTKKKEESPYLVVERVVWHDEQQDSALELRRDKKTNSSAWYEGEKLLLSSEDRSRSPILSFQYHDVKASDQILEQQEKLSTDVEGVLCRGEASQAQAYLQYLVSSGEKIVYERYHHNYYEAYLQDEGEMNRFIYLVQTENSGVVICSPLKEEVTVPTIESITAAKGKNKKTY